MPNIAKLRAVLDVIGELTNGQTDNHNRTWDQSTWHTAFDLATGEPLDLNPKDVPDGCGTAMCFAGWTCELAGAEWYSSNSMLVQFDQTEKYVPVDEVAQILLDLNDDQASLLFAGGNGYVTLVEIVDSWEHGPLLRPLTQDGYEIPGIWTAPGGHTVSRGESGYMVTHPVYGTRLFDTLTGVEWGLYRRGVRN